ncbi:DoxX family protein [Francisella sp. Scap27]|uniref:HvfX family Cu-binding RiPP maturation protein n=1 Tax=Francisella sp. Scap27 TaxID=2589986 RepID=UPI0015BEB712|nr:DoxX family protein [Francisella sp. Scap27]QLE78524.1 DoxX family protein [Francisella sp. Scap27]
MINKMYDCYSKVVSKFKSVDFLLLLGIRLYLVPTMFVGARSKIEGFHTTATWFATPASQGGLGMPFPEVMAFLATSAEVIGCVGIALGLFTRLVSIPMMFVMGVAGVMVHWTHGWPAIADKTAESTQRLNDLFIWLAQNFPDRYNHATALGDPVVLNGGMEFSVTYFIMLFTLFIYGGGRYVSADHWLKKIFIKK